MYIDDHTSFQNSFGASCHTLGLFQVSRIEIIELTVGVIMRSSTERVVSHTYSKGNTSSRGKNQKRRIGKRSDEKSQETRSRRHRHCVLAEFAAIEFNLLIC